MKPTSFPQQTKVLAKPDSMTDKECGPLPVYNDGKVSISCWQGGFKDKVRFLFTGKIWLWVTFGATQPPVAVATLNPWCKNRRNK